MINNFVYVKNLMCYFSKYTSFFLLTLKSLRYPVDILYCKALFPVNSLHNNKSVTANLQYMDHY